MNNREIMENFWQTMAGNDFYAVSQLLHEDYILEWPQSGERIRGRENFAAINTFYPTEGTWRFAINSLIVENDTVVTDVSVSDGRRNDRVITFSMILEGKILKQVEFWPDTFEAPAWRSKWIEKME